MKKTNKRIGIILLTLILVIGVGTVIATQKYPDLNPTHWCFEKIMQFVDKGYIEGYEDGTMRPDRTITRAEYVKIVNNFFGFTKRETTKEFKDISGDAWYASHVYTAVANGYIEGFEDNTFRPEKPITRQEATVILSRILEIDEEVYPEDHKDGLAQYPDGKEVEDWAYTPIHSYSVYNFINGYEDGTLRILQDVTRAETVELLHLLEQKIEIEDGNGKDNEKEPEEDKPSGGTTPKAKAPAIKVWQITKGGEYVEVTKTESGWFNYSKSTKSGDLDTVVINVTSKTTGSTIQETLSTRTEDRTYVTTAADAFDNKLFLPDGVYTLKAKATKNKYRSSNETVATVKVDTIAPEVNGVYRETTTAEDEKRQREIEVTIVDPKLATVNEISNLNESKLRYAWFKESGDNFVRFGDWNKLSDDTETLKAPTAYGTYKLGVSAYDIAENSYGTLEDIFTTASGEEKIPFDFVEEVDSDDDIIVIIGEIGGELEADIDETPEPGSKITYDLTIDNKEKNEENVKIKFNRPVTVTIENEEHELESGEFLNEKISILGNDDVTIEVSTIVPDNFPVASGDFDLVVTIGILSGDDEIVETKKCDTDNKIEKTVTVATSEPKDKNVVVVIDMSGSMLFCTEHTHYESYDGELPYRFPADYDYEKAGFTSMPSEVRDGYLFTGYPLPGHEYKKDGKWVTCSATAKTRIEITRDSLHDFVEVLANAAKVNDEKISFTIVTFDAEGKTGETFVLSKDTTSLKNVKDEIDEKTNLTADASTNIGAGVDAGVAAFNNDAMLENAENYFVFFGDGKPTTGDKQLADDFTDITADGKIDYAYAIGFGAAFEDLASNPRKVLEAITGGKNVTHAENAQAIMDAFDKIAKTIAEEQQSEEGKITIKLPENGTYCPVYFTYVSGDDGVVELYKATTPEELLVLEDVEVDGNELIWDISGTEYSALDALKIQLTFKEDEDENE